MFKSKIFLKALLVVVMVIATYTVAITAFVVPKINNIIYKLEEKNAKEVLDKVVTLTKNVANDLENFKKISLKKHKDELKNLTSTAWSITQIKYIQSKPENIGTVLKNRGDEFKSNIISYYNKNKNSMSKEELKKALEAYVNIRRYNNGTGYFFILNGTTTIMHPLKPSLNGKDLKNLKDVDGVYFIKKFVEICDKEGSGIVKYKWENPKTKKIEDKISYVFKFEPFNWIVGTGEYYSVLQKRLKKYEDRVILSKK